MTRLEPADLTGLGEGLEDYDLDLEVRVGRNLRQIACRAAEIEEDLFLDSIRDVRVGVVPTTFGMGVLSGFSDAVRDILEHIGCYAFVPERVDVAGLAAVVEQGAGIVFVADDRCFSAIHFSAGVAVDNNDATGRGYVAALEGMVGGFHGRRALVIGAGGVGIGAAKALKKMGARLGVFDRDRSRAIELAREVEGAVEKELERALQSYRILVEATPASGIIEAKHIQPTTAVAAPGIPLGLSPEAKIHLEGRWIHDPLQIGVATMMAFAVKPSTDGPSS